MMTYASKAVVKEVEDVCARQETTLDLLDRGITGISEFPFSRLSMLTRVNFANNKLTEVPASIDSLRNLEFLNLFNNSISVLPTSLNSLTKLSYLNVACNKLTELPRGFGSCPALEIFDCSSNKITKLPNNMNYMNSIRALYLSDNEIEEIPEGLALRDNKLKEIVPALGSCANLRELYLQGNMLRVLPVELGNCDRLADKTNGIFKLIGNPLIEELLDMYLKGVPALIALLKSPAYATVLENFRYVLGGFCLVVGFVLFA
ncbi:hypothetical protein CAOG_03429 [Capsaspora owczarzaki ATCC 30864]|uniref:Uncharacterized protein n=1 Tax=Capsaspora owczarzaki (strain ATCC 30864) TaxID=595528 RepID=A0A0D2UBP7_CAPO3|nr:hypothetical protein CAOG_03429 [Capsaspora owczarzaki ATCC 30864]KJE92456.1 hypothetical protein CAOG_003429 [Capsaspora owczarzaki ATCC 30864]|eukprot:XP_004364268.2 hypothetical protein CAOG_03429 [Capsaspora owczarzaki ATCC 30864]